jgi:hypothetical protein
VTDGFEVGNGELLIPRRYNHDVDLAEMRAISLAILRRKRSAAQSRPPKRIACGTGWATHLDLYFEFRS